MLFCCFMVANSMGLWPFCNREINMLLLLLLMMMMMEVTVHVPTG